MPNPPSHTSQGYLLILERERGRKRERGRDRERDIKTSICSSTYLCLHWLILVCALTKYQTHNFGVSGQCSNQLSYPARNLTGAFHLKIVFSEYEMVLWPHFLFYIVHKVKSLARATFSIILYHSETWVLERLPSWTIWFLIKLCMEKMSQLLSKTSVLYPTPLLCW